MKVRIKKAPQMMAYGGQKKHSLDIVRTTIDDYNPDYNDVESRYARGADPRDESTAEVEGGEIIVEKGGDGSTRTFKAVGPNHNPDPNKEGGVPMNLKEGAFVFSKRKGGEMGVKGSVLKGFNKSEKDKKTYSFAQLADQYKTGPLYDILQSDKTDDLQKRTAAAMIQKYEDKLAGLALLQESRKGFPQGIPDIAQEKFAKMQQYMQQAEQQKQMQEVSSQQPPMAMYGYNVGGAFVPDYSAVSDMYRYQAGGSTGSQNDQIAQYISAYAQLAQKSEEEIYQALQSLAPAQQQEALQTIVQTVQQAVSKQQGGGADEETSQQMGGDNSGYYSAPGGEPQYVQQEGEEEQQMKKGGSYSGTYYQGTYFQNGGAFVPMYGDSSYNDQFGGQIYDYDDYMLPRADEGLEVNDPGPKKVTKDQFEQSIKSGGYVKIGPNIARRGNKIITYGNVIPGQKGTSTAGTQGSYRPGRTVPGGGRSRIKFTLEDLERNPNLYKTFLEDEGWKNAPPEEKEKALKRLARGERSIYVPGTPPTITPDGKPSCEPGYTYNDVTGKCEKTTEVEDFITFEEGAEGPKAGDPTGGNFGGGYYGIPFPSTLGIMAAAAYPPLYLRPFYGEPQGVIPRPTFYDPERELASAQESARALEQMGSMMNPQTAGALANYIQANAAKTSADVMGRYQNLNVGVANQFSPLQAQIFNSLAAQKREAADKRFMGETIAAQQYQNAMRTYGRDFAKTLGEGIEAGIKKGQLYDASQYYTADPFGRLRLKPGVNAADLIMNGSMAGRGTTMSADEYLKRAKKYKDAGYTDQMIRDAMRMQYGSGSSSRSSSTDNDDVAFNYGSSAYPFMS